MFIGNRYAYSFIYFLIIFNHYLFLTSAIEKKFYPVSESKTCNSCGISTNISEIFYVFRKSLKILTSFTRSSHRRCSVKKVVLRNFAKFIGKLCARDSFLIKSLAQVFSCKFCEISKNTFFTQNLRTTASVYPLNA